MSGNHDRKPAHLSPRHYRIQFVGGPFDGHVELFPDPAELLPQDLMWFVCANVFHILEGKSERPKQPITSIAVYERMRRQGMWRYDFVGALSPKELSLRLAHGDFFFTGAFEASSNVETARRGR
jgi:hypothetical protein